MIIVFFLVVKSSLVPHKSTILHPLPPHPPTSNQQREAPAEPSQKAVEQPGGGVAQEQQSGTAGEEVDEEEIFAVRLHIAWKCTNGGSRIAGWFIIVYNGNSLETVSAGNQ